MSLRISQLQENENIRSDRFAMAAISYIYKAFGDITSSKACWPWSEKGDVNVPWESSEGVYKDVLTAKNLLTQAVIRYRNEHNIEEEKQVDSSHKLNKDTIPPKSIKDFKRQLNALKLGMKQINKISTSINNTSTEYHNEIDFHNN